jgi:hypothetical protein
MIDPKMTWGAGDTWRCPEDLAIEFGSQTPSAQMCEVDPGVHHRDSDTATVQSCGKEACDAKLALDIRLRADSGRSAMWRLKQSDLRISENLHSLIFLAQAIYATRVDCSSCHESRRDVSGCHRKIDAVSTHGR